MKKYKPMSRGLGILDGIKRAVSVKKNTQWYGQLAFKTLVLQAPVSKVPLLGAISKRILMFTNRRTTQGYSIPLNIKIAEDLQPVALPIDLLRDVVKKSSYRFAMNSCICRDAYKCTQYPHDLACIFLGKGAEVCVKNGIAHEATLEECMDRIGKAANLGLAGQSYWIEIEGFIWGIQNEDMDKFLEIFFCCPCCCAANKFMKRSDSEARLLFYRSIGYVATVGDGCANCNECIASCPRLAIKPGEANVRITEECGGCGICVERCPTGSLEMRLIKPLKPDLRDYYQNIELKL